MLIGLHDAECEHMKGKTFPNYALMKISAYHKSRRDFVEWWNPLNNFQYDRVYSSKVFDFTPENPYLHKRTIKGGTGYGIYKDLSPEIDEMFPDYSIYPECDYAIGYITRGCPNKCGWCVVPKKEGDIKPYRRWRKIVRSDSKKLVLMDNNILSCGFGISELEGLIGSGYAVDINQGLDARLVDERAAGIIGRLKWIKYIRFSCDSLAQTGAIRRAAALLEQYGIKPYRLFIYLLITKDINNAARRVEALRGLTGISLYAQAERNDKKGIVPNRAQLEFAQRYVYGRAYRKETWSEYCEKRNLKF
ncbi:MAG: radical SAM protein [Defluviitaleaceae bacterium]|nr:radical SAM protein [Defluviitaleaceae bacterium]